MSYDYSKFKDEDTSGKLLDDITMTAESLKQRLDDVTNLEKHLHDAKADVRHLAEVVLPELMERAGLGQTTLADGTAIAIEEVIKTHLSKERAPAGLQWLRDHGHDSVIKTRVISEFTVGHDDEARELADQLCKRNDATVILDSNIHPMTLTKTIKELIAAGEDVPLATFGVERIRRAKVK